MDHINELLEAVRSCKDDKKLQEYACSERPGVAIEVARSDHVNAKILDMLTRHNSIVVRHAVAQNENTSKETLKRLIHAKDQLVRDYALVNLGKKLSN